MKNKLDKIYQSLYQAFGPQNWWPGDTSFEIMLGAILTQNTNWQNVEKAIKNLKAKKLVSAKKIHCLPLKKFSSYIRPAGYHNLKAKRIKNFLSFFKNKYKTSQHLIKQEKLEILRKELLGVNGIGPETCDSILLYALNKPIFVVDTYTKRILSRHNLISQDASYHQVQDFFMKNLPTDIKLFNEYHALLVKLGKDFCLKKKPRCQICPLKGIK